MNIIEQRFLRGPNLYASVPCMMTVLDPGMPRALPASILRHVHAQLAQMLPGLEAYATDALAGAVLRRLGGGQPVGLVYVLALVQRELQRLAGAPAGFDEVRPVRGKPGQFRLVSGYESESLAAEALTLAVEMIATLAKEGTFDLPARLDNLRVAAARHAVSPAMEQLLDTARQIGIPVLRLSDEDSEFQLGWGALQKRVQDTGTGLCATDNAYPEGNGRIPVIAVTGTNGKTTTALMLAHGVQQAGLRCGLTTTEGVYINGERTFKGDCSGYWSARRVLTSPEVDFAVLETARGGILKRGLAFDRCDVAIVLNVTADHLGLDGIETVRDLARVKGLVAKSASRAVVLNAEDPHCAAMAMGRPGGVEQLYFSLDPDHPVLLRHLEHGGRAAYLQDGELVLADGARRHALLQASAMPAALGGHARYNIANGLAAAAALMASGFGPAHIASALRSFVSDSQTNPLRSNIFSLPDSGLTLIVDYAHNPAAYSALGKTARSMTRGRTLGVITAPGDRRDIDLRAVGEACAPHFDQLTVYESARRGREPGAAGVLITGGIAHGSRGGVQWRQIDDVRKALDHTLGLCEAGDVLVYSCPSTLDNLVEALQGYDPAGARLVAEAAGIESSHHVTAAPAG
ncbi:MULTISPECIES: Mur ligase family protein [unclassified Duganella]|uniref:Mur ligase family protein n=1 Tax=unclassified Duganella TaxID=2636909 RepID=UPI0008757102|nr:MULTISPECIES: Mur ligase family protein [unclassified Duganella]OEZ63855.1 cyanophycin synthetase [Duganella sp. HH105]OFA06992.1 cyanophycin synthetase [Duganella sp. HH101]